MHDLDKVFERVAKLTKELEMRKTAQSKHVWEEYDSGKHRDPKETEFTKTLDDVLEEGVPSSTVAVEDAEPDTEKELQETYALTDASSAGEGDVDVEVRGDSSGEEAKKAANYSDEELFRKYAASTKALLAEIKVANHKRKVALVASLIKQAEADAGLLLGFVNGFVQTLSKQAQEEAVKDKEKTPEEAAAEAEEEVRSDAETSDAVDELAEEAAKEPAVNTPEEAAAEAEEEVRSDAETSDAVDELAEDVARQSEVSPEVGKEQLTEMLEDVVEADPTVSRAIEELADQLTDKLQEGKSLHEAASDVLGETGEEEVEAEEEREEEPKEKDDMVANEADNAMQEMGVTPEQLEKVRDENKVAKKLATIVRNFRRNPHYKVIKAYGPRNTALKERLKEYLYELLI